MSSRTYIISGDIHLRIKSDIPEEWQLRRYRELWGEYIRLCTENDADLILSGDIFDNHKITSKEMMLFLELCTELSDNDIQTYIIDGNHDYTDPNNTTIDHFRPLFDSLSENANSNITYLNHFKEVVNTDLAITFISHSALRHPELPKPSKGKTNILISHFRPNVNEFIKEELDVSKFVSGFDYCFVSDIHTDLELDGPIVYTNSPLNSSFESSPKCGCLLVRTDAGNVSWSRIKFDLPSLVQITATPAEFSAGIQTDPRHFYRITVNGTSEELRAVKCLDSNVKLLKVPEVVETYTDVESCSEVKEVSLEDDLIAYMKGIPYSQSQIKSMMEVFYGKKS